MKICYTWGMALQPTRMEVRLTLSHVDRQAEAETTLIVGQHPSETAEHFTLRLLAWCLYYEPQIAFGPGLSAPDSADLWAHDLTGALKTWVECGAAPADRVKKLLQHQVGVAHYVLFADPKRADELLADMRDWKKLPKPQALDIAVVDAALVNALAQNESRRQTWTVTIADDHCYVTQGDDAFDGAVTRYRY